MTQVAGSATGTQIPASFSPSLTSYSRAFTSPKENTPKYRKEGYALIWRVYSTVYKKETILAHAIYDSYHQQEDTQQAS